MTGQKLVPHHARAQRGMEGRCNSSWEQPSSLGRVATTRLPLRCTVLFIRANEADGNYSVAMAMHTLDWNPMEVTEAMGGSKRLEAIR